MLAPMQRRQNPQLMKRLLVRRERHGWSWAELSRRCGLPVWKLRWWCVRLERAESARRSRQAFVPVEIVASPRREFPPLEVVTPSGVRILVPKEFDAGHLRRVVEALEPPC